MNNTQIRFANEKDVALIFDFVKDLAEYEKMSDQVVANEAMLREWIFEKKKAGCANIQPVDGYYHPTT